MDHDTHPPHDASILMPIFFAGCACLPNNIYMYIDNRQAGRQTKPFFVVLGNRSIRFITIDSLLLGSRLRCTQYLYIRIGLHWSSFVLLTDSCKSRKMQLNLSLVTVLTPIATLVLALPIQALSTPRPPSPSIQKLLSLSGKVRKKVPGSNLHKKAWTNWCGQAIDCIKEELALNLPYPVNALTTEELAFQLGVAADKGDRPSFADAGSRSGYAMNFFCRAKRLADMFVVYEDRFPDFYTLQMNKLMYNTDVCRIASIGGGPGFDYTALALAHSFKGSNSAIEGTVYDYEDGWSDLVDAMWLSTNQVLQQTIRSKTTCRFGGKCDITKSFSDTSNVSLCVRASDIIVCQYCVAENANLLRESDFIFFRDLFDHAKEGALVILTETTHRLWPDVVNLAPPGFQVALVRSRGIQLVLQKQTHSHHVRPNRLIMEEMKQDARDHELKMEAGYKRQQPRSLPTGASPE